MSKGGSSAVLDREKGVFNAVATVCCYRVVDELLFSFLEPPPRYDFSFTSIEFASRVFEWTTTLRIDGQFLRASV